MANLFQIQNTFMKVFKNPAGDKKNIYISIQKVFWTQIILRIIFPIHYDEIL